MKLITTNFIKCSVKTCDNSNLNYPLKYKNCIIEENKNIESEDKYEFIKNIIDRIDWNGIISVNKDLGNTALPLEKPIITPENEQLVNDLYQLLIQTSIVDGEMQCNNCQHVYYIKNGIPNLLLPPHLA